MIPELDREIYGLSANLANGCISDANSLAQLSAVI